MNIGPTFTYIILSQIPKTQTYSSEDQSKGIL
jgi:hypothetical protein